MAGSRPNPVSTVWFGSRPMTAQARRHTSFSSSIWTYPVIDDSISMIDINRARCAASTPTAPRARWTARQHHRFSSPHHPYTDWHRGPVPAGTLAAQEPRQGLGHAARPYLRGRAEKARGSGQRQKPHRRPRSAGATRSVPTFCSPISWSRTCAPAPKAPARRACWTVSSIPSWKPRSAQRVYGGGEEVADID